MPQIKTNCPHCEEENWIEVDDCAELEIYEDYCNDCKKIIQFRVEYTPNIIIVKAGRSKDE